MNNFLYHKARGFTLIELLVVIAIIGVLGTIVTVSLNNSRSKPRDARRLADLKSFQLALEGYFTANDHYPYTNCSGSSNGWASFDSPTYAASPVCDTVGGTGVPLAQKLLPYISTLKDPKNLGTDSGYLYINQQGAFDYCVLINRTPENMNNFPPELVNTSRCGTVGTNGQCSSGSNAIYFGKGYYQTAANC